MTIQKTMAVAIDTNDKELIASILEEICDASPDDIQVVDFLRVEGDEAVPGWQAQFGCNKTVRHYSQNPLYDGGVTAVSFVDNYDGEIWQKGTVVMHYNDSSVCGNSFIDALNFLRTTPAVQ